MVRLHDCAARNDQGPESEPLKYRVQHRCDTTRAGVIGAIGKIKLGLGDTTGALDYFERALRARDPFYSSEPLRSPIYAPLPSNDRFTRIVQAAGLSVEWVTAPRCC